MTFQNMNSVSLVVLKQLVNQSNFDNLSILEQKYETNVNVKRIIWRVWTRENFRRKKHKQTNWKTICHFTLQHFAPQRQQQQNTAYPTFSSIRASKGCTQQYGHKAVFLQPIQPKVHYNYPVYSTAHGTVNYLFK